VNLYILHFKSQLTNITITRLKFDLKYFFFDAKTYKRIDNK